MSSDLFPNWPTLEQLAQEIRFKKENSPLLKSSIGIPYLCFRLAQNGFSICMILEEDKLERTCQDIQSYRSVSGELKDWSIGFLSKESSKENRALLEKSLEAKGLIWLTTEDFINETNLIPPKETFLKKRVILKVGKLFNYSELMRALSSHGYRRVDFVEDPGEFTSRGEIIDLWTPQEESPIRIIFLNDTIETMHLFDPLTQRNTFFLAEIIILPLPTLFGRSELGTDSDKLGTVPKGTVPNFSLLEYFPSERIILEIRDRDYDRHSRESGNLVNGTILDSRFRGNDDHLLNAYISSQLTSVTKLHLNWNLFRKELEDHQRDGIKDFVFCQNMGECERLEDILDELKIFQPHRPQIFVAPLSEGFLSSELKICVWSFADLIGIPPVTRRKIKLRLGRSIDSLAEVVSGDYVVHENYGIGRYRGLEQISLKLKNRKLEKTSEFLALEYKGGDRLLVPLNDFKFIQKYVGQEGKKPPLYSLDGVAWDALKQKTQNELAQLAGDLLKTAALRSSTARPTHGVSHEEYSEQLLKEFIDAFPYEETPDQKRATDEILQDLDSSELMERLLCGDVGYGKTEIAMRAAFKKTLQSKQVAVLVPTTILAEQHFETFSERFALFPVKIGMLSRFQKKNEQTQILSDLKKGAIDIIIGTHRLISKDVEFKDLGLLIIDEEHRFGVQQKEKLKKLRSNIDVLSLSATPIPRTLTFALGGAREISMIETAPQGRLSIETYVGMFDEELLKNAISRELTRGGQIFYVYNHIKTIHKEKERLEKLYPSIRIGIAHGQMNSESLENAMWSFLHKKWDILLSTSIIESGLDIPNVNTIIIQDCQEFGLAQLYQLRGRVGRNKTKAYCYLFFSDWANMSEDAQKRLEAIQEFSNLGSGFKLSLRDMEIRGAGEILGAKQHGWIQSVGLELYCKLLSEEIQKVKIKGEKLESARSPNLDFPEIDCDLPAYIPENYIENPGERIGFYKKMVTVQSKEELNEIKYEVNDRFGELPEALENLFEILDLRWPAKEIGLASIAQIENGFLFSWPISKDKFPIDLENFTKEHPDLIEIQPLKKSNEPKQILSILFTPHPDPIPKEERESAISIVKKFLQISSKYITI